MTEISADRAQKGIAAAAAKAREIGSAHSISIVDSGRNLLAFHRMDNALLASIEISQGKAYTARSLNMKTGDVTQYVQPGGPFYAMETSHRTPLVVFGGGLPVELGGKVVGAVGVAGGSIDQDVAVAEAAIAAITKG
ncbi:MAG TPA: heme-binding protein [Hypericibacter adhaerens]|jgi:uncharacterized protein GlcG (DUF336 family)|uniref:PduO protein n=1 Tax=Hypericibacter adhaerens TaxID=2602016 RepID=A0A5J6MWW2_9PROT|nr:heme-binding protein [Hypericibacter adhaerens]QEX21771.1 hypothetical protein FRZ61_17000 [Hypericibacter adhaerens]HWA42426.1 heme-binding protein [Hypericibacter adhaerens]